MEYVKPWMIENILKDLGRVLRWRDVGNNLPLNDHTFEGGPSFEDDSGNLRIVPSKTGQIARISKFPGKDRPVRAVLSDSETRINVTLEIAATDAYLEKHHREIFTESLGGLLQLNDYEIVATTIAPRASQLILIVKDFQVLGAEGSGTVGSIPRPIELLPASKELLSKLAHQTHEKHGSTAKGTLTGQSSPASSSIQSPAFNPKGTTHVRAHGDLPALASQVPTGNSRSFSASNLLSANASVGQNAGSIMMRDGGRMSDDKIKALLWKKKDVAPGRKHEVDVHTVSPDTGLRDSSGTERTPVQISDDAVEALAISRKNVHSADARPPETTVKGDAHSTTITQSAPRKLSPSRSSGNGETISDGRETEDSIDPFPAVRTTLRPRSRKITMRDIKTPKDQEYLLEQPYAWIPAEPSHATLQAKLPTNILSMLNARAERRMKGLAQANSASTATNKQVKLLSQESSHDISDTTSEHDEEYSWEATPTKRNLAFNDLPPDSSPPVPIDASESPLQSQSERRALAVDEEQHFSASQLRSASTRFFATTNKPPLSDSEGDAEELEEVKGTLEAQKVSPLDSQTTYRTKAATDGVVGEPPVELPQPGQIGGLRSPSPAGFETGKEDVGVDVRELDSSLSHVRPPPDYPNGDVGPGPDTLREEDSRGTSEAQIPSTAPVSKLPYTQVKRTPYVNGFAHEEGSSGPYRTSRDLRHEFNPSVSPQSQEYIENSVPAPDEDVVQGSGKIVGAETTGDHSETTIGSPSFVPSPKAPTLSRPLEFKRRQDFGVSGLLPQSKRLKVADLFPESGSQDEDELVSPALHADKNRREFFERRSSAGSAQASLPVSPAVSIKISHATFQALAPAKPGRASFSGPHSEVKTPSRLRQSALRLDTAQLTTNKASQQIVAVQSPERDQMDTQAGAQYAPDESENPAGDQIVLGEQSLHLDCNMPDRQACKEQTPEHDISSHSPERMQSVEHIGNKSPSPQLPQPAHSAKAQSPAPPEPPANGLGSSVTAIPRQHTALPSPTNNKNPSPSVAVAESASNGKVANGVSISPSKASVHDEAEPLYDRFILAYPEYSGNEKHFRSLCTKLLHILESGSIIPAYLLDDFVIRHKAEYSEYVQRCADEGEDADSYQKYYAENTAEALHTKRVLTRQVLSINFEGYQSTVERRIGGLSGRKSNQQQSKPIKSSLPMRESEITHVVSPTKEDTSQPVRAASPEIQMSSPANVPKLRNLERTKSQDQSPVFIDLTFDGVGDTEDADCTNRLHLNTAKEKKKQTPRVRRSLPWPTASSPSQSSGNRQSEQKAQTLQTRQSSTRRHRPPTVHPIAHAVGRIGSQKSPIAVDGAAEVSRQGTQFYKDPYNPFNSWKRLMDAVTPAKGNSFASDEQKREGIAIQKQRLSLLSGRSKR